MMKLILSILSALIAVSSGFAQNLTLKSMNVKGNVSRIEYITRSHEIKFGDVIEGQPRTNRCLIFNSKGTIVGEWYICRQKSKDGNNAYGGVQYDSQKDSRIDIPKILYDTDPNVPVDTIYRFFSYGTDLKPASTRTYNQYGELLSMEEYVYQDGRLKEKNVYTGTKQLYSKQKYEYYTDGKVKETLYYSDGKEYCFKLFTIENSDTITETRNSHGIIITTNREYTNHKVVSEYVISSQRTNYVYDNLDNLKKQYEVTYSNFLKKYIDGFPVIHYHYENDKAGNWYKMYTFKQNTESEQPEFKIPDEERVLYGYDESKEQIDEDADTFLSIENRLKTLYAKREEILKQEMEKQAAEKERIEKERNLKAAESQKEKEQIDFMASFLKKYIKVNSSGGYDYITITNQLTEVSKVERQGGGYDYIRKTINIPLGKIKKTTVSDGGIKFLLKDKTELPMIKFVEKISIDDIYNNYNNSSAYVSEDGKIFAMMVQCNFCRNQNYFLVIRDDLDSLKIYEMDWSQFSIIEKQYNSL